MTNEAGMKREGGWREDRSGNGSVVRKVTEEIAMKGYLLYMLRAESTHEGVIYNETSSDIIDWKAVIIVNAIIDDGVST
jgi:hypothetical protein